ncbi:hypothetical protein [Streptomyces sp. McG3]|uniref:hypothetical protein n=1 Tax=Streptomyces sp. McG3 TaxID=2725483 RepID=UPI001BE74E57|nr:hypothetical protein [Streptomyces sp. McG3]MBT2897268.1 hypothetical protein [Streptomyces sp. McG3]
MGWTVLYIAFGLVALWLLGEVLLQYKARLRWRLLAFGGFLGVVVGVLLASVPVIVVGTLAFATGQTFVTLSFRRGFSTGWAIGGSPGESRRRRGGGEGAAVKEPTLEVSDLEVTGPGYDPYTGYEQPPAQDPYAGTYDYGTGQQSYAAYSDPYIGTTNGAPSYGGYDPYGQGGGDGYDSQGGQQSYPDPYAQGYVADTPPGGVWVPQQRDTEQYPPMPPEQPAPYGNGNGYDTGQNEQHRY